jgi:hypothetical protein
MGQFSRLIESLTAPGNGADRAARQILDDIRTLLREQQEIRFFVDGTYHFGHQAGTINLLKRLIDSVGYAGRITVVYADHYKLPPGTTARKLAVLLAGLDPRQIDDATIAYRTCANIRFLPYARRAELEDWAGIGLTGGADDMSINFAAELKVRYFLRLQPYLWDDDETRKQDRYYESSRIEEPDGRYFYIVDEYPRFRSLAYKFADVNLDAVGQHIWAWYAGAQTFDLELKATTATAQAIYRASQASSHLQLWPLYGLHHFSSFIAEMAMNLVFAALQAQQSIRAPIVAFSMSRPADTQHFADLLVPFSRDLAQKNYALANFRAALLAGYHEQFYVEQTFSAANVDAFVAAIAARVRPWIDAGYRLTFFTDYDGAAGCHTDISARLTCAIEDASDTDLIVALVGTVPMDVYDYFYATCQIPGVFEGQASSSLLISRGRPFLQIPRPGHVIDNNYPAAIGDWDCVDIAAMGNDAARQLRDQRYEEYLRASDARDPGEYFAQLGTVSDFILNTRDASSDVYAYFAALGDYYQSDIHDKFMLGLLALLTRVP